MNLQKAYSSSIGRVAKEEPEKEQQSPADDAVKVQAKIDWLQATVTQKMFGELGERYTDLIRQAVSAACSDRTQDNIDKALKALIRADEVKNILNTYATH